MNFAAPVAAQIIISVTSAVAYLLFYVGKPASLNRTIIKTLSIAALAALAVIMDGPLLLVAALALSALGDLFISRDGEAAFLAGLGSFLLAHGRLCRAVLAGRRWRRRPYPLSSR